MKLKTILATTFTALAFVIVGCEDKKAVPHDHDGDGKPDHGPGAHRAPVPHDHDGDGVPDHGPGEHDKHVAHDHDGDGKPDHGPDEDCTHKRPKKVAGPNGGKIMTAPDFKNELFITKDRMVRITFLDDDNKPVAIGTQEVNMVGGDRSNPTMLTFSKADDGMSLISSGKLPEGIHIPIIITVKTKADANPARASLSLNLADCSTCDYQEYACTCDHHHSPDHGPGTGVPHDHDGDGKPDH